jgi:hypothetical protein
MEGRGPPAAIAQGLNGGYGRLEVMCDRCETLASLHWTPSATAGNADLEVRGGTEMPIVPDDAVLHMMIWPTQERKDRTLRRSGSSRMMMGEF